MRFKEVQKMAQEKGMLVSKWTNKYEYGYYNMYYLNGKGYRSLKDVIKEIQK